MLFKTFKQFLREDNLKTAVFTWGRFNPPTAGHELVARKVKKLADSYSGGKAIIYTSQSTDPKKNPLNFTTKVKFLQKLFPFVQVSSDSSIKGIFDVLKQLYKNKFQRVLFVVGSDRVQEFKTLIGKYNKPITNKSDPDAFYFDEVLIVAAGKERDNSDAVSGISGTKMREFAIKGDLDNFSKNLPSTSNNQTAKELFAAVRNGLRVHEDVQPVILTRGLMPEIEISDEEGDGRPNIESLASETKTRIA